MISYAQNREDVVLARAFAGRRTGFYIDVGAEDPVNFSVTKHFYDLGWRGINVEPTRGPFALLEDARPYDVNLCVGLADFEGTATLFEGPPENHGSSTFDTHLAADLAAHGAAVTEVADVPINTLANVCKEWVGDRTIDFLKIDVEGWERAVIDGGDWDRWRPRVVVVEAVVPNNPTPSHHDWEPILLDAGYVCTLFDGLNRFYARADEPELHRALSVPANVFDDAVDFRHAGDVRNLRQQVDRHGAELQRVRRELHLALEQLAQAEDEIALQDVEAVALRQRSADAITAAASVAAAREAAEREVAALHATKTFRWTSRPRRVYGWTRRRQD